MLSPIPTLGLNKMNEINKMLICLWLIQVPITYIAIMNIWSVSDIVKKYAKKKEDPIRTDVDVSNYIGGGEGCVLMTFILGGDESISYE